MNHQCLFCFCRAFDKLLQKHVKDNEERLKMAKEFFSLLAEADTEKPAPYIARNIHAIIRQSLNNKDPYKEEKHQSNEQALSLYDELKEIINGSDHGFNKALRYALAGNIIDYGPSQTFDIHSTLKKVENSLFAIDHSEELEKRLRTADSVLYIGDNAGEIVFDKLFIETMQHPNVIFAVRGAPVINDATWKDAEMVGMNQVAHIIDNGYDAPSTILEMTSKEFRDAFDAADVIIAKGQGNFEGLMHQKDQRIWFLLMVKCEVIGNMLNVNKGDFVVSNGHGPHS
ncbi:MAG: damage-control phosphatase ARMT1 family protein [Bacteroidales bacterium]